LSKLYLKNFISEKLEQSSEAYLYILFSIYNNIGIKGRISNSIKGNLNNLNIDNLNLESKKNELKSLDDGVVNSKINDYPKMKSIQIKDFRGFGSIGENDKGTYIMLDESKNIFFGANGSGKTSLCEAFEYELTSNVKETKRRNLNINDYIKRNNQTPQIKINFNREDISTKSFTDEQYKYFQMSLIEKNRLQEFSLLGSKDTGTKEQDVIATLLGLQDLDDLTASLVKPENFRLNEWKKKEAENKLEELDKSNIEYITVMKELEDEIITIEKEISEVYEINISDIDLEIKTYEERIEKFTEELKAIENKNIINHKYDCFENELVLAIENCKKYSSLYDILNQNLLELDHKLFYEKLSEIMEKEEFQSCPVCETPIDEVTKHPSEKVNEELIKLKEITEIQNQIKEVEFKIISENLKVVEKFSRDYKINSSNFVDLKDTTIDYIINDEESANKNVEYVESFINYFSENKQSFHSYFDKVSNYSKEDYRATERKNHLAEILKEKNNELSDLKYYKNTFLKDKKKIEPLKVQLTNYEKEKQKLSIEKKREDKTNLFLYELEQEYKKFYEDIYKYKLNLEKEKLNNIEAKTIHYYNQINCHDDISERISSIKFKIKRGNYRIFIVNNEKKELNAHSSLSEGHLRSLGLSMMLAVAEKNQLPFLIFDDVVNAIDSDHRANIIEMMFNDSYLEDTQLIVTTHDRLFWERFCNYQSSVIAKNRAKNSSYVINYSDKGSLLIQYDVSFDEKIKNALKNYDIRQALVYSRIWFETMATEYCVRNKLKISGQFSNVINGNHIKVSLESIYKQLGKKYSDNSNFNIIKNDLINWKAQNQEHHSYDEHSFNFVHSKNSDEISKIYEALKEFEIDINLERKIKMLKDNLNSVQRELNGVQGRLSNEGFLKGAKQEKINEDKQSMIDLENREKQLLNELDEIKSSL